MQGNRPPRPGCQPLLQHCPCMTLTRHFKNIPAKPQFPSRPGSQRTASPGAQWVGAAHTAAETNAPKEAFAKALGPRWETLLSQVTELTPLPAQETLKGPAPPREHSPPAMYPCQRAPVPFPHPVCILLTAPPSWEPREEMALSSNSGTVSPKLLRNSPKLVGAGLNCVPPKYIC